MPDLSGMIGLYWRMSSEFRSFPVLPFLLALLTGCASHVSVDGQWQPGAARDASFSRVLVVGVSHNAGARCDFESFLVTQLRDLGTAAKSSCILMKSSEPLTEASVEAAVAEYGADAVLATVLVHSQQAGREGGDAETRGGIYFKATGTGYAYPYYYRGGYGRWGVPVVYGEFRLAPVIGSVEGEVEIRTMLFETRDATMVYEVVTAANDLHSREDALASITPPIARKLDRAGLLAAAP